MFFFFLQNFIKTNYITYSRLRNKYLLSNNYRKKGNYQNSYKSKYIFKSLARNKHLFSRCHQDLNIIRKIYQCFQKRLYLKLFKKVVCFSNITQNQVDIILSIIKYIVINKCCFFDILRENVYFQFSYKYIYIFSNLDQVELNIFTKIFKDAQRFSQNYQQKVYYQIPTSHIFTILARNKSLYSKNNKKCLHNCTMVLDSLQTSQRIKLFSQAYYEFKIFENLIKFLAFTFFSKYNKKRRIFKFSARYIFFKNLDERKIKNICINPRQKFIIKCPF